MNESDYERALDMMNKHGLMDQSKRRREVRGIQIKEDAKP